MQLKRMKQIEVEKDILMQGLEAVDRAREWYLKQIAVVQDKMQYIGKMGYSVSIFSIFRIDRLLLHCALCFTLSNWQLMIVLRSMYFYELNGSTLVNFILEPFLIVLLKDFIT